MSSPTEIVNIALTHINDARLASLDDDASTEAVLCREFYDLTRRETLQDGCWDFASERISLPRSSVDPSFGYAYAYPLATDHLRLLEFEERPAEYSGHSYPFEVESHEGGRAILTDCTTARVKYIKDITDTTKFDPLFTRLLTLRLASQLAIPIAGTPGLRKALAEEATLVQARARVINAASRGRGLRSLAERLYRGSPGIGARGGSTADGGYGSVGSTGSSTSIDYE